MRSEASEVTTTEIENQPIISFDGEGHSHKMLNDFKSATLSRKFICSSRLSSPRIHQNQGINRGTYQRFWHREM
jgi:hypothetical protein